MSQLSLSVAPLPLGKSDIAVFPLAWGMWRLRGTAAAAREKVAAARDLGVTLFDTADIYNDDSDLDMGGAETLFGAVLGAERSWRQQMIIATKGGILRGVPYDSSATYLQSACEASLRRLGIDCIDLYQIHRPDLLTHPQEVARALTRLHAAGKIRTVGVSNYTVAQTRALQAWLDLPIVSHQPEFSPLHLAPLNDGVLDHAMEQEMAVLAWSPLGGGSLLGAGDNQPLIAELDRLAEREQVTRASIVLAWVMTHPSRPIPIIGAQSPDHIRQFSEVFSVTLSRQDWYRILVAARGEELP